MDYLTLPERIASKIEPCPTTGCWLWTAYVGPNGYGYVASTVNGKRRPETAHRLVYKLLKGPIPEGLECDHLCRVRSCCNPMHIEPVTTKVNARRGDSWKTNGLKTQCPQGHPLSGDNLYLYPAHPGRNARRGCLMCILTKGRERYRANPEKFKRYQAEYRMRKSQPPIEHGSHNG